MKPQRAVVLILAGLALFFLAWRLGEAGGDDEPGARRNAGVEIALIEHRAGAHHRARDG